MQNTRLFYILFGIVAGCVTAPTQEMSDARLAIKAAQQANAVHYVPNTLVKAEENLAQAEDSLRTGQLIQARRAAILAKQQAINARKMALAIKYARNVWQAVVAIKLKNYEINELIEKAENAAQEDNLVATLHFSAEAQRQGTVALNQAYLEQTEKMLCGLQDQALTAKELAVFKAAWTAFQDRQGEKAYEIIKELANKYPTSQKACSIKSHKQ